MDVKTCRRCGALFHHVVGPRLCHNCKKKDEEDFQRVKEYLYENPGAAMATVCEDTNVTVKQVRHYLREGRLTVSKDSPIGLDCESCGARIVTGRYCDICRNNMSIQFASVSKSMKKEEPEESQKSTRDRMRYLDSGVLKRKR